MRLALSPAQAAEIMPHSRPGWQLLGRVEREPFSGSNAETSGALQLIFVSFPAERLDAVRRAIAGEPLPKRKAGS